MDEITNRTKDIILNPAKYSLSNVTLRVINDEYQPCTLGVRLSRDTNETDN
jgi:hypothetical protein